MTCHLVAERQMITVGGQLYQAGGFAFQNSTPSNNCDWESKGVAILDLSTLVWGSVYDAHAESYLVPTPVVKAIGGT